MSRDYTHLKGILPGAFQLQQVSVSASTTSGQIMSFQNPEFGMDSELPFNQTTITPGEVWITTGRIIVKHAPAVSVGLDLGVGAAATTDADNLIDGLTITADCPVNTIYGNIGFPGSHGKVDGVYFGPSQYCNLTVVSGNANGLVVEVEIQGQQPIGGTASSF